MITTESIYCWVKGHSREETYSQLIYFKKERLFSTDAMMSMMLDTAYMFLEIERERRREAYYYRLQAGFTLLHYYGYRAYTFEPQPEEAMVIREIFEEAAAGVDIAEMTFWLNDCGFRTVKGNFFTPRAVRSILSNPVYKGDVLYGDLKIMDHHTPLVERSLWEKAQQKQLLAA